MTDRTEHSVVHSDACRSLRCPCYVEGRAPLIAELRRLQRVLIDAEVLTDCESLCPVLCAGPCEGVNAGTPTLPNSQET